MKKLGSVLVAAGLVLAALTGPGLAAFPDKPITHIIPAQAGGGWDLSSRVLAVGWEKILGQPIKFDYAPGASGMIALNKMIGRPADGYTTTITTISMQAMNLLTGMSKIGWDKVGFLGNLITDPDVLLVQKDAPYKTVQDFIEAGKKAEKPLTISTSHPKAVSTLAALILIDLTGIKAKVVAFDGGAKARDALAGKQVDACLGPYFSSSPKKDFVRALASFTKKKVPSHVWDVPTLTEATGKPFPALIEPFAFMARRETMTKSPDNYKKLVETFKAAMSHPDTKAMADKQGMTPFMDYWTPDECEAYVKEFNEVWEKYKHLMK